MKKELLGVLIDKNHVKYKLYSNGKAYRVEDDGIETECTDFLKKNLSNLFIPEECDVIDDNLKKKKKSINYKIPDLPEIE